MGRRVAVNPGAGVSPLKAFMSPYLFAGVASLGAAMLLWVQVLRKVF